MAPTVRVFLLLLVASGALVAALPDLLGKLGNLGDLLDKTDGLEAVLAKHDAGFLKNFTNFAQRFGKKFANPTELAHKLDAFKAFKALAAKHQALDATAQHGETKFADFTAAEFHQLFTGHRKPERAPRAFSGKQPKKFERHANSSTAASGARAKRSYDYPTSLDYRNYGVVTSVKDQGSCGDCYAFTSVAVLESSYGLYYGVTGSGLGDWSEAEATDCPTGNYGCNGGWGYNVFEYVLDKPGITSESAYPFKPTNDHSSCHLAANAAHYATSLGGYFFTETNETDLAQTLWDYGPLYIAIDAAPLQTYVSGIISMSKPAAGWNVDHAVTLIGYGTASGVDYWLAKNSWGSGWGENGFFRFRRGTGCLDVLNNPTSIWFDV